MSPEQITLGCDPELVCRINGEFTSASNYFKYRSSMGVDGNDEIAELRPGYSTSPIDLTAKIRTVLEYGHEQYPNLEFISGHYVDDNPIGGHIHLGVEPTPEVIEALDIVLSAFSDCIDDQEQVIYRRESGYGKKKSYRNKHYGLEYRTPGSFLLSPTVALVTFTLAKLAVIGAEEDKLDFDKLKGRDDPCAFLLNFEDYLVTIPEDCREGLDELKVLLKRRSFNWEENILPNWGLVTEVAA